MYDRASDRLIVFGGRSLSDPTNVSHDTWLLLNASGAGGTPTWQKLTTSNDPPAREAHSAIYDPATSRMIIFGGTILDSSGFAATYFNDVWILTHANGLGGNATWYQRTPNGNLPGLPAARSQNGAVYDQASNTMTILFGSDPAGTTTWNDVWVLQDADDIATQQPTWQMASQTGNLPSPVGHFATAYAPASHHVTMFGGCCGYSNATFVGTLNTSIPSIDWLALSPAGATAPAGDVSTFGYDRTDNKLIALDIIPGDGTNGTWLLTDANGIGNTASWINTVPGGSNTPPYTTFRVASGYNSRSKTFIDALDVVDQSGNLIPEVWILSNADRAP